MFRYEIGARILIRKRARDIGLIEVEILNKSPNRIKVRIMSEGWFKVGSIYWLSDADWFSVGRVR